MKGTAKTRERVATFGIWPVPVTRVLHTCHHFRESEGVEEWDSMRSPCGFEGLEVTNHSFSKETRGFSGTVIVC